MHTIASTFGAALASFAASTLLSAAAAQAVPVPAPALVTQLTATRLATETDGRETQHGAQAVRPGDTVLYRASFRNGARTPLSGVNTTVPVPAGTQFVAASALPAEGALASVDGVTFEPMPLMRKVRGSDGVWRDVPVPAAEYRALRWPARTLAAGQTFSPSLRVRVIGAP